MNEFECLYLLYLYFMFALYVATLKKHQKYNANGTLSFHEAKTILNFINIINVLLLT